MMLKKTFVRLLSITVLMWFVTVSNALDYGYRGLLVFEMGRLPANTGSVIIDNSQGVYVSCKRDGGRYGREAYFNTLRYNPEAACSKIFTSVDRQTAKENANTILRDMALRLASAGRGDTEANCVAKKILIPGRNALLEGAYKISNDNPKVTNEDCIVWAEMWYGGT